MNFKYCIFPILLTMLCSSCSYKLVPSSINNNALNSNLTATDKELMISLNTNVEKIVNAGGNLKRGKAIIKRAKALNLSKYLTTERIDWLSFQKNILIEIKGRSDKIVYLVAHYDKIDTNPMTLVNTLVNGVLDPLISWSYTSHGAIDNATGVSISLQLAKKITQENLEYTYRILLVGAEEAGLRGSRSHVARLTDSIASNIIYVINTDVAGVKNKKNCVYTNVSDGRLSSISLQVAKEIGIELGVGKMPALAGGDYSSFKKTSFFTDFGRSLKFNLTGAFLPQRSYFTKKKQTKVISFNSCEIINASDYISGLVLLPIGSIHGFRDNIKLVDEKKMYEQYLLIYNLIKKVELLDGKF